jgi:hypothetical protein
MRTQKNTNEYAHGDLIQDVRVQYHNQYIPCYSKYKRQKRGFKQSNHYLSCIENSDRILKVRTRCFKKIQNTKDEREDSTVPQITCHVSYKSRVSKITKNEFNITINKQIQYYDKYKRKREDSSVQTLPVASQTVRAP